MKKRLTRVQRERLARQAIMTILPRVTVGVTGTRTIVIPLPPPPG